MAVGSVHCATGVLLLMEYTKCKNRRRLVNRKDLKAKILPSNPFYYVQIWGKTPMGLENRLSRDAPIYIARGLSVQNLPLVPSPRENCKSPASFRGKRFSARLRRRQRKGHGFRPRTTRNISAGRTIFRSNRLGTSYARRRLGRKLVG